MIGIYKITSPSGKIYIGQSWDISYRFDYYCTSKAPGQPKLNNSFKKYGQLTHSFEVIAELLPNSASQKILDELEISLIHKHYEDGFQMLNIAYGGGGGRITEATKKKLSELNKGEKHPQYGKKKNPESIEKRRIKMIGWKQSPEAKEKLRKANTGRKMSPQSVEKTRQANIGRVVSIETRIKTSNALKGVKYPPRTEEHRRKISENKKKQHAERKLLNLPKVQRTQEQRKRISEGSKGKNTAPWSKERKQKHSNNLKAYYAKRKIV